MTSGLEVLTKKDKMLETKTSNPQSSGALITIES